MNDTTDSTRRALLQAGAALAAVPLVAQAGAEKDKKKTEAEPAKPEAIGRPGDFDFLTGEWRIENRRLKPGSTEEWDEFEGEATVYAFLNGIGSLEELRIPARQFAGMGLRLLDVEKRVWNDFWVNAKSGVLTTPGLKGVFKDGAGVFEAEDKDGDIPIIVRGVWDEITAKSCRWHQSISRDAGKTWQYNWWMKWTRKA